MNIKQARKAKRNAPKLLPNSKMSNLVSVAQSEFKAFIDSKNLFEDLVRSCHPPVWIGFTLEDGLPSIKARIIHTYDDLGSLVPSSYEIEKESKT